MAAIKLLCILWLPLFTAIAILILCSRFMGCCRLSECPIDSAALRLAMGITVEPSVRLNSPSLDLVQQNGSEFYGCGIHSASTESTTSRINLLNYNRCVAQAMIVAVNANEDDAKDSLLAHLHAETVNDDLDKFVSKPLKGAMTEFITRKSWVKNNPDNLFFEPDKYCPVLQSHVHAGRASNVVIDDKLLSCAIPFSDVGSYPYNLITCTKGKFIAGYSGIKVNDMTFDFVPFCPGAKPHLVSTDDFEMGTEANSGAPPNAFGLRQKLDDSENDTNLWSYPMAAAAIGGKIKGQKNAEVFTASIPGGYIELCCHLIAGDQESIVRDEKTFEKLLQRCREIQPTTTAANLKQLLQNSASTSSEVYIYLEDQDPDRALIITDKKPITFTGVKPDEATSPAIRRSNNRRVYWTPSTGFGNLLGRLSI